MLDRETTLTIWGMASMTWLFFAFVNSGLSIGDIFSLYSDHPTSDEKTIAWQRFRNNAFRLYISIIFTLIGWLSDNDPDENRRVRTTFEEYLILAFVITPIVGAIFEGWQFVDRRRMRLAYGAIGRRQRSGSDTATGNDSSVHNGGYHRH